jgi:tetratricopeptide (TPR) repeat protein
MKNSNVALLAAIMLVLGFIGGVAFTSLRGPAPGMQSGVPQLPLTPQAQQAPPKPAESPEQVKEELARVEAKVMTDPGNPVSYVEAGNFAYDHELWDKAIEYYNRAIEIGGENPDVLTDAGAAYRRLGQFDKSVEYFRRARKADPKHAISALNLGIVLFHDLQKPDEALEAWRDYLALDPQGERAEMIRRTVIQIENRKQGN